MTTTLRNNKQTISFSFNSASNSHKSPSLDSTDQPSNSVDVHSSPLEVSISPLNLQVNNIYGDSSYTPPPVPFESQEANGTCQTTHTNLSPYLTVESYRPEEAVSLNYSDLGELQRHFNVLPTHIQLKVRTIADKQRWKASDFWYDGYYPQTTLISLVEYPIAQSVCRCGFDPGRAFRSPGLCHKPRLCWKCADLDARRSLSVFQPNFGDHSWGFLTVSFHGDLPYSTSESPTQWLRYWKASVQRVKNLFKTHNIWGAIIREELKINSIAPIRVLPHIHAIVSYPDLSQEVLNELAFDIHSDLSVDEDDGALHPSIDFETLPSNEDVRRAWMYIYKPTLFYEAYQAKWDDSTTPQAKECLNRSMRDAIEAAIVIPKGLRQIHYVGNMNSRQRRDFIGVLKN